MENPDAYPRPTTRRADAHLLRLATASGASMGEMVAHRVITNWPIEDERECPGWGSNPHCAVFKTASSADWDTGAWCRPSLTERVGSAVAA